MKSRLETPRREGANLASEWFQGCKTEEERKELNEYIRNSTRLFDHLKTMLQRRYNADIGVSRESYKDGWAYSQAHTNGRLEVLEEIYKLLP